MVKATMAGNDFGLTVPKAKLGFNTVRLSRSLARKLSVREARGNGYIESDV